MAPWRLARRHPWRTLASAAVLLALLVVGPIAYLYAVTAGERTLDPGAVGEAPVALVFGGGIRPDGSLTPLLRDRVELAVGLYEAGRVEALLMTGDHSRADHDEVDAMKEYAVSRGVPAALVSLDHAGFDTYDSCYRAKRIFGVDRAIVVTTRFHLPRAVYTCRRLGVRAEGLGAPDLGRYPGDAQKWHAREVLAAGKAVWQLHVTRPKPRFLGPREPFPGSVGASAP